MLLPFVLSLCGGIVSQGETHLVDYTYDQYVLNFSRNYDISRKSVFEANLKAIRTHNANPLKLWFMSINEFADLTAEEFAESHLGAFPSNTESGWQHVFSAQQVDLPDSMDWRDQPGVITDIKNQGSHCGSCWAVTVAESLESHYAIATGEAAPVLSAQQVTSCTPNPHHCGGTGGCDGNTQTNGFNYTATVGLTDEFTYPYIGTTSSCNATEIKPCVKNDGYVHLKRNDYTSLITALATIGPMSITLAAKGIQHYGGGIIDTCDCDVNHAVQLVGYGADGSLDYWLVRNSWGPFWGEQGYFKLQRFGAGKEPSCIDSKPQDGVACEGDTTPKTYYGLCGMLSDSSYPTALRKLADCAPAPSPAPRICDFTDCTDCSPWCVKYGPSHAQGSSCKPHPSKGEKSTDYPHCKCWNGAACHGHNASIQV